MTELEQLYFNDKNDLREKIEDALREEDQSFIDKVNQEFSYEYHFNIDVSGVAYAEGRLQVDTLEEAERYNSGELDIYPEDVYWYTSIDMDENGIDVDSINAKVSKLSITNPSPEAQELLKKSA